MLLRKDFILNFQWIRGWKMTVLHLYFMVWGVTNWAFPFWGSNCINCVGRCHFLCFSAQLPPPAIHGKRNIFHWLNMGGLFCRGAIFICERGRSLLTCTTCLFARGRGWRRWRVWQGRCPGLWHTAPPCLVRARLPNCSWGMVCVATQGDVMHLQVFSVACSALPPRCSGHNTFYKKVLSAGKTRVHTQLRGRCSLLASQPPQLTWKPLLKICFGIW